MATGSEARWAGKPRRAGTEKRRALRAPVHGHAVLHGDRAATAGVIHNLSLGGALVRVGEVLGRTDALDVELRLPSARRVMLRGHGIRVDREGDGPRMAVGFDRVPPDAEDAIEDAVITALSATRARHVLVVDAIEERQLDVAAAMRARELTPLTPRTPLEAIELLGDPANQIDVCAVSARFADVAGGELTAFLKEAFPWVRIVRIGDDAIAVADDAVEAWHDVEDLTW
jgi:hypothetical protein